MLGCDVWGCWKHQELQKPSATASPGQLTNQTWAEWSSPQILAVRASVVYDSASSQPTSVERLHIFFSHTKVEGQTLWVCTTQQNSWSAKHLCTFTLQESQSPLNSHYNERANDHRVTSSQQKLPGRVMCAIDMVLKNPRRKLEQPAFLARILFTTHNLIFHFLAETTRIRCVPAAAMITPCHSAGNSHIITHSMRITHLHLVLIIPHPTNVCHTGGNLVETNIMKHPEPPAVSPGEHPKVDDYQVRGLVASISFEYYLGAKN